MDRREAETALVERALTDPTFRARLLADPRAAIRDALGIELSADTTVTVHEETADALHLVLPPASESSDELDDLALDAVAGGGRTAGAGLLAGNVNGTCGV